MDLKVAENQIVPELVKVNEAPVIKRLSFREICNSNTIEHPAGYLDYLADPTRIIRRNPT